jgi:hypothetical protein
MFSKLEYYLILIKKTKYVLISQYLWTIRIMKLFLTDAPSGY